MKTLLFASENQDKYQEILEIQKEYYHSSTWYIKSIQTLPKNIQEQFKPIEKENSFSENAKIKAKALYELTTCPVIAEDSGVCIDFLQGAPGVKSARFAENDTLANKKVLELLKTASKTERGAVFYSCFCLYISFHQIIYFIGSVKGDIHFQSVGENGFGYDSIFYYSPLKKTFGEVPHRIKMQYSHRAEALGLLFTFLSKELV